MTRLPAPINLTSSQRLTIREMGRAFAEAGRHRWADQCRAILLLADGFNMEEACRIVDRPYSTVQQWSRRFRRNGIRGLEPKTETRGSKKKLDEHERLLLAKAIERGPRANGINGSVWTSSIVSDYIKSRWDVVYHPAHVRKILHQLGFSVQFPREKLALADKKAQETWLRETYPEIKKTPN